MPVDPTIRQLFDAPQPPAQIDVAAVVRRSRARRVPKVLGVAGVSVLAIGGLFFGGVQVVGGWPGTSQSDAASLAAPESATDETAMSDSGAAHDSIKRAPASQLNLCAGTVADVAPSATGLVLVVSFADSAVGSANVEGTVTMTNTGTQTWMGYTAAAPAITLAQNGIVIWHSNGPMIEMAREVDLAPGESLEYAASFVPVVCGVEDDMGASFRADLPAAAAGEYQVSAAIDLMGDFDAELITGPASTITLR